jgi:predicted Zn-dependent protease
MGLVSGGEDSLAAAEKTFGDLEQLQKGLERYIYQASYAEFVLSSAAAPIDESAYQVRPLAQVEIDARRADVLTYVTRESEARALLDTILKEDPNNVLAHETMGSLEMRAGHRDEARNWYGEAVKLDSKNYLAYYYFASLSMNAPSGPDDGAIEDSLRKAIQLNPRFAPSYDRLAVFYSMRHANLDEAHMLSVQAVQLDPGQVVFRQNCANVLMALQRYDDAVSVLKAAEKVARNPGQVSSVQYQIEEIERFQRQRAEADAYRSAHLGDATASSNGTTEIVTVVANQRPVHPAAAKDAAKHAAVGVIHDVVCSYPAVVEFKVTTAAGKSLSLYNNQMQTIDLSALGFTPSGSMNPCSDFEGRKAKVEFAESPDKSVDGQVIAIELRK